MSHSAELTRMGTPYLDNSPLVAEQEARLLRRPFQEPPVHGVGGYVNGQEAQHGSLQARRPSQQQAWPRGTPSKLTGSTRLNMGVLFCSLSKQ